MGDTPRSRGVRNHLSNLLTIVTVLKPVPYKLRVCLCLTVALALIFVVLETLVSRPRRTVFHKIEEPGFLKTEESNFSIEIYADKTSSPNLLSQNKLNGLKQMGFEPPELHSFKSPYIYSPQKYPNSRAPGHRKTKIISIYHPPDWYPLWNPFEGCPYSECILDVPGYRLPEAQMVIFFVGYFEEDNIQPPPYRPINQLWVKAFWESPVHYSYPKDYEPWKSVFNLTYNYRLDSDIFAPLRWLAWRHSDLLLTDDQYLAIARQKTKPVAWFVSNCRTQSDRDKYVWEMKRYISVDVYGSCGSLTCSRESMEECMHLLNTTYNFYLSFENSICRDYVSEKFLRMFENRTMVIPVGRGGAVYRDLFPPDTFVDTKDFPGPRELALYLKEVSEDPQRYAQMLKEKDRLTAVRYFHDRCHLCEKLHTVGSAQKIIPDIRDWSHNNTCFSLDDF